MVYWNNKLGKYQALLTNAELARHLPLTNLVTKANVRGMLEKYRAVYLKPNHGTGGFGIFKLSRCDNGYRLQNGTHSRSFETFERAFATFEREKRKKIYLVQKGSPCSAIRAGRLICASWSSSVRSASGR